LRATLKGKVVIEADYGGRAEVAELEARPGRDNARWTIDPTEVERTFKSRNKPLELSVSIDGKRVLINETMWAIGKDPDAVWRNLKRVELRPFQQFKVKAIATTRCARR